MTEKKKGTYGNKPTQSQHSIAEKNTSGSKRVSEKELDTVINLIMQKYAKAWKKLAKI